jgi:hypothetical protein
MMNSKTIKVRIVRRILWHPNDSKNLVSFFFLNLTYDSIEVFFLTATVGSSRYKKFFIKKGN